MQKFRIVGISVPQVMKFVQITCICLLMLVFLSSCTALGMKSWAERSPKEKALAILDAYNAEFQNTLNMALKPNLTDAQKQVVRQKKAVLTQLYPLIQLYLGTVEAGGIPSVKDEQAILNLIDQLGGKL